MDGDRKYKQHGYMDSAHEFVPNTNGKHTPASGPRLPRMVEAIAASRCWNCSTALSAATDFSGDCAKCGAALHCCKQCSYFDSSTRFQCRKPVSIRVARKDEANDCSLFQAQVTVARDSGIHAPPAAASSSKLPSIPPALTPRDPSGARAAFDSLFKK